MGILTLRKVIIRRQLGVPSSSSDDDLPLVKHDAWVDLNPSDKRIRYTQEHALVSDHLTESAVLHCDGAVGWITVRQGVSS
jgi:hypothetical protein